MLKIKLRKHMRLARGAAHGENDGLQDPRRKPRIGPLVALLLVLGFWSPFYYVSVLFPGASLSANPAEMEAVST